ncbi:MAG: thiamine-phosphate kinase [Crocinitomicaceae bacterium]|nr:thiamine-phosphate kinase [Crocinitomicaceae bacterium]
MEKTTPLSELGEFGLIKELTDDIQIKNSSTIVGVGDDCAVLERNKTTFTITSSDTLMQGIHFDLMYQPLKHLGYKSIAVNLSDIYAMNGQAKQVLINLAIGNRFSVEAIKEIYDGMKLAAEKYGVDIVGGDITSSYAGLGISITAIGEVDKKKIVYRSGAKENDLIVVSGDLGGAYMGLQLLEREKEVFKSNPQAQPEFEGKDYLLERQLKPEARKDIVELLEKMELIPTSMIDISDGLASELLHICQASNVGAAIYDEKIPIDPDTYHTAVDFNLDPYTSALNGGEDYELLFTIKQEDYDKVKGNPHLSVIGHITDANNGVYMMTKEGQAVPIEAQGWNHFREEE